MNWKERPFAIVTGASRGIGAAYARRLAAQGYDLLLVSRDKPRLEALAVDLRSGGLRADFEVLDLSERHAANRLYTAARERREHVDLLINNAGFGLYGPFVEAPMAAIQQMLRVHVQTVVETIRLFLPGMQARRRGAIINIASTAGFFSVPYLAEYAATKAFLIAFSEALAEEVRPFGVRVQACCPGSTTETDFHATAGLRIQHPFGSVTAARVAAVSLAALEQGPVVVTIGWKGRVLALLGRLVPRSWIAKGAARRLRDRGGVV